MKTCNKENERKMRLTENLTMIDRYIERKRKETKRKAFMDKPEPIKYTYT
jgi:hypothetical protein